MPMTLNEDSARLSGGTCSFVNGWCRRHGEQIACVRGRWMPERPKGLD